MGARGGGGGGGRQEGAGEGGREWKPYLLIQTPRGETEY